MKSLPANKFTTILTEAEKFIKSSSSRSVLVNSEDDDSADASDDSLAALQYYLDTDEGDMSQTASLEA